MFALQWATQELTNDDSIFLSPKVLKVNSIADLNPKLFGAQPEFSYFIQKEKIAMHPLNIGQAQRLAAVISFTEDSSSIFNPQNIYDFYSSYLSGRYENIIIKFHLEDRDQADGIYRYMHEYVVPFLGNQVLKQGTS